MTGGHLTPALALIEELKKNKDVKLIFYGRKFSTEGSKNLSAEYKLISALNVKFRAIIAGRLQRKFTKYTIFALLKIPIGFIQSFIYLALDRPEVIISFGGYLSLPAVFCGWLLQIKSITHEQSIVPGLANKLNSLFTAKVFLTWPESQKYFSKEKSQIIGNLTRNSIFIKRAKNPKIQKYLSTNKKIIFITGGNQGSHFLNKLIFESLGQLSNYQIIHQVGTANYNSDQDKAIKIKKPYYLAFEYLNQDDIGAVLNRVDLVISRSGANTIWDLAVLAKVSILIPLPISASGEQAKNALSLEKAGSAIVLKQSEVDKNSMLFAIDKVFTNLYSFKNHALNLQKTLPIDSAKKLADYILSYT